MVLEFVKQLSKVDQIIRFQEFLYFKIKIHFGKSVNY